VNWMHWGGKVSPGTIGQCACDPANGTPLANGVEQLANNLYVHPNYMHVWQTPRRKMEGGR
jgi:hypothetical protein